MPDHYFTPRLEFTVGSDPTWIATAIEAWEQGSDEHPRILGSNGQPLPPIPALEPGLIEHRWGGFSDGPEAPQYRLRLEVTGTARRKVNVGIAFGGLGLPGDETRGGGDLVRRLTSNWKHRPNEAVFPTRLREVGSATGVRELFDRLITPGRLVPILVVTRRSRNEETVADVERLHEFVLGMAEVWSVPRTTSTFELGEAFVSRGFDQRWNCYDGGVRLYLPNLDPSSDSLGQHPIVLASRLQASADPTEAAAAWALGTLCRALEVDEWRARWREEVSDRRSPVMTNSLGDLERLRELRTRMAGAVQTAEPITDVIELVRVHRGPDELVPEPQPTAEVILVEDPTPIRVGDIDIGQHEAPVDSPAPAPTTLTRGDVQLVVVDSVGESTESGEPATKRPNRVQRGRESLREAFDAFADLEELLQEFQTELESVRSERDALARERDDLSQALQDLEQTQLDDDVELPSSPAGILTMFQELGEGRLRITRYALRKAADSKYDDAILLGRVLAVLLVSGPDFGPVRDALAALVSRQARAKPKDSPQTMAKFGGNRRFALDDGTTVTAEQHITLGHGKRNPNETFQVYWRKASDGVAEVVYAGEHLPTVSADT